MSRRVLANTAFPASLLLAFLGACADRAPGSTAGATVALADAGVPLRVLELSETNLPPRAVRALAREVPHVQGEVVARPELRERRRGVPASLRAWEFPLSLPARTDPAVGRVRWGGRSLRHQVDPTAFEPPYWTVDGGVGVVVLAGDAEPPAGDLAVDYALDVAALARLDGAASRLAPEEFVRRRLTDERSTWSALYLPAPTVVALDVVLPPDAQLRFVLGSAKIGRTGGDGAVLDVAVNGEPVASLSLDPDASPRRVELDLSAYGQGPARLRLGSRAGEGTDAGTVGDYPYLGDPRLVSVAPRDPVPRVPRNLVFVLVDTLRADHLGLHGYTRATSPAIDALAREGAWFTDAQAQSSWTRPAMASIFTGLYPSQHGVLRVDASHRLAGGFETLAERLRAAGFQTASFVNNPQLGHQFGLDQGFGQVRATDGDAAELVDRSIAWLRANGDAPFFLYLHVADPHDPWTHHGEFDFLPDYGGRVWDLVDDLIVDKLDFARRAAGRFHLEEHAIPWREVTPAEREKMLALYDGEIAFTDQQLGRLFAALEEAGLREDTLIVLTSDHGEEFGEHGGYFHGYTLYREVLHVPLILAGPGIPPGTRADELAMHVDLLPTLLDALRLEPPEVRIGRSLLPLLRGEPAAEAGRLIQETGFRVPHKLASTEGGRKTIWQSAEDRLEVYDLALDPNERVDVLGEHRAEAERVRDVLRAWREEQADFARIAKALQQGEELELDEELRREMAAMGYGWGE